MWSHISKVDLDFGECINKFILRTAARGSTYPRQAHQTEVPVCEFFRLAASYIYTLRLSLETEEKDLLKMVVIDASAFVSFFYIQF